MLSFGDRGDPLQTMIMNAQDILYSVDSSRVSYMQKTILQHREHIFTTLSLDRYNQFIDETIIPSII